MSVLTSAGQTRRFNPWVGCEKVSPACTNCYASVLDKRAGGYRTKGAPSTSNWGKRAPRHITSDTNWRKPARWNREAEATGRPRLVFCASMADVFEDRADLDGPRARLWELIEATPHLIWQLLTKRPENVRAMVPARWTGRCNCDWPYPGASINHHATTCPVFHPKWPPNVWIGTTVEDQRRAELRLDTLLLIPAPVRFVSFEPLLGPINLDQWALSHDGFYLAKPFIQWAIVGGESGAKHRLLNLNSARNLVDQLQQACIPTWFKQVGGLHPDSGGHLLDGREYREMPAQAQR